MEPTMSQFENREDCLEARAKYFEQQRDELLAALKPFANMSEHFPQIPKYVNRPHTGAIMSMNPGGDDEASITVEDLHAAKAAIAKCES